MSTNSPNPFVPFPFVFPSYAGHQQAERVFNEAPARVRTALVFLDSLSYKTATGAAVSSIGIEVIDGQKLSKEETGAQNAACDMLRRYFNGELELNHYEKSLSKRIDTNKNLPKGEGKLMNCFHCTSVGERRANCALCNGGGSILVYAVENIEGEK